MFSRKFLFLPVQIITSLYYKGNHYGVVTNVLGSGIVVNRFEFQSRYYTHFRTVILEKVINPLSYGLNNTTAVLLKGLFWYQITHKNRYAFKHWNQIYFSTCLFIWHLCTRVDWKVHVMTSYQPLITFLTNEIQQCGKSMNRQELLCWKKTS